MTSRNPVENPTGSTGGHVGTESTYSTTTGAGAGASASAGASAGHGVVDERSTGKKIRDLFSSSGSSAEGAAANTGGTTSTTRHSVNAGGAGSQAVSGVGGAIAAIHGAGEKLRGEFNAGVDRAFDEPGAGAKNANIAAAGDREIQTGHFDRATKERELGDPAARRGV